jgi:hypothetical protein
LLSEIRSIEEELGREENADIIANEILKLMENLNKSDNEKYNELYNIFEEETSQLNTKAQDEFAKNNIIEGGTLYQKIARILTQIGELEKSEQFKNAANQLK